MRKGTRAEMREMKGPMVLHPEVKVERGGREGGREGDFVGEGGKIDLRGGADEGADVRAFGKK